MEAASFLKMSVSVYDLTYCQTQENYYLNNTYCKSLEILFVISHAALQVVLCIV